MQAQQLSLEAARQSLVLLENHNNMLPVDGGAVQRLAIVGGLGGSVRALCGGWTLQWQGAIMEGWIKQGGSILAGFQEVRVASCTSQQKPLIVGIVCGIADVL